ncbi:hypothetical protein SCHPADRAFT_993799 [Schizopora paradoxa]|uniref:Uncharacterized protein n=1 Tax=Schizopora paradoxa TaxID=27342 RepID=A0A0H2S2D2_9AGAM|nr:hypothetical protein SCHPADRAFT_993799 [Schizopora paradoxa]
MKFDEGGFESDLREVLSSWIACKEAIPSRWKGDVQPINPMSFDDLQALGITGCSRLVSRARKTMQRLTSLSDTLRDLSSVIQAESQAAQENLDVVSNMCSLVFLPNELLVRIFRFVVNGDAGLANSTRTQTAVSLSHVSQYFRRTALSCSSLWSNISGNPRITLLSLSRCKDALLDVAMRIRLTLGDEEEEETYELALAQSLIDLLPHSKRWRSLEVSYFLDDQDGQQHRGNHSPNTEYSKIPEAFYKIDLRSLESLCIRNIHDEFFTFKSYHEFQHWETPRLQHLTSVHYFPLSLPGLANLTSLNVTLNLGEISPKEVLRDLSRMQGLESLALKLEIGRQDYTVQQTSFEKAEFPRVYRLKIELECQQSRRCDLLKMFLSSLSFPGAVDLHIKLGGYVKMIYFESEPYLSLSQELGSIIQHVQFPRVGRFCLEANALNIDVGDSVSSMETQQGQILLDVSLGLLPTVKHLTLRSNGCLRPRLQKSVSENALGIPALETITVQITKWAAASVADFLEDILTKGKEQEDRETLREVVIMDNGQIHGRNGDDVKKAYTGHDALEWCRRRKADRLEFAQVNDNFID